jgi:hypothetical protein
MLCYRSGNFRAPYQGWKRYRSGYKNVHNRACAAQGRYFPLFFIFWDAASVIKPMAKNYGAEHEVGDKAWQ